MQYRMLYMVEIGRFNGIMHRSTHLLLLNMFEVYDIDVLEWPAKSEAVNIFDNTWIRLQEIYTMEDVSLVIFKICEVQLRLPGKENRNRIFVHCFTLSYLV